MPQARLTMRSDTPTQGTLGDRIKVFSYEQ